MTEVEYQKLSNKVGGLMVSLAIILVLLWGILL